MLYLSKQYFTNVHNYLVHVQEKKDNHKFIFKLSFKLKSAPFSRVHMIKSKKRVVVLIKVLFTRGILNSANLYLYVWVCIRQ